MSIIQSSIFNMTKSGLALIESLYKDYVKDAESFESKTNNPTSHPAVVGFRFEYETLCMELARTYSTKYNNDKAQFIALSTPIMKSFFLKYFDDRKCNDILLSDAFSVFTLGNLTSPWRSIRNGRPIEIELNLRTLWTDSTEVRNYFNDIINTLSDKFEKVDCRSLDDLTVALDQTNPAMRILEMHIHARHGMELAEHLGNEIDHVRLSGVVKLHPAGLNDKTSHKFHNDGDNSLVKVIIYLEDNKCQPYDGAFTTAPTFFSPFPYGLRLSYFQRLMICGDFILDPMNLGHELHSLFKSLRLSHSEANHNRMILDELPLRMYPIVSGTGAAFSGSYVMHKGGDNINSRRPVIQGYIHCIKRG